MPARIAVSGHSGCGIGPVQLLDKDTYEPVNQRAPLVAEGNFCIIDHFGERNLEGDQQLLGFPGPITCSDADLPNLLTLGSRDRTSA